MKSTMLNNIVKDIIPSGIKGLISPRKINAVCVGILKHVPS